MRIHFYRCLWGVLKQAGGNLNMPSALSAVKQLGGYKGVELPIRMIMDHGRRDFIKLLRENDLKVIPMVFTDGPMAPGYDAVHRKRHPQPARDVLRHVDVFKAQIHECLELAEAGGAVTKITAHSGLDSFKQREATDFFSAVLDFQQSTLPIGLQVNHETHRHRILYSPWVTREILPLFPDLTITADYSHHVNVCEAPAADKELSSTFAGFAGAVRHVHARYGHDQGPQIPDPRAPEFLPYVRAHDGWWKYILKTQAANGTDVLTVTPEHGPAPYQISLPYSAQPLANVWDVNTWVATRFAEHAKRVLKTK